MTKDELIQTVCREDASASEFLHTVTQIAHVWDDLIDQDQPILADQIHQAFVQALVALPLNAFYRRHFDMLHPVLVSSISNWLVANELERAGSMDDLRIAFISRSSYVDLVTQVAFLVGGFPWVRSVGPEIRRFAHEEGWDVYLENLETERAARKQREGD